MCIRDSLPANLTSDSPIRGQVNDADVYGVVGSDVSFHDRDAGYSVTQGDYFVIDSQAVGSTDGTWTFRLIEESIGSVLVDVRLPAMA